MNLTEMSKWSKIREWFKASAVILSAVGTLAIALSYRSQIGVMENQLETMQEAQRVAQKPLIKIHLHKDPDKLSTAGYEETDEGGERWTLYYYVLNIGNNPAYNIRYWHSTSIDSAIQVPDTNEFESLLANDLLFPSAVFKCGADQLLRQVWLDDNKKGIATYRHFFISYRDEYQNRYMYHAMWRIVYEQGQPLNFVQVSYELVLGT